MQQFRLIMEAIMSSQVARKVLHQAPCPNSPSQKHSKTKPSAVRSGTARIPRQRRSRGRTSAGRRSRRLFSLTPSTEQIIQKAIDLKKRNLDPFDVPRTYLIKLLARIDRMHDCIDVAYCGLMYKCSANYRRNLKRFRAYLIVFRQVMKLLFYAIDLWLTITEAKRQDQWVATVVEQRRRLQVAQLPEQS